MLKDKWEIQGFETVKKGTGKSLLDIYKKEKQKETKKDKK